MKLSIKWQNVSKEALLPLITTSSKTMRLPSTCRGQHETTFVTLSDDLVPCAVHLGNAESRGLYVTQIAKARKHASAVAQTDNEKIRDSPKYICHPEPYVYSLALP